MFASTFKDCMFGQVRSPNTRHPLYDHEVYSSTIPETFNIQMQQAITWDNATGMNPLYNESPFSLTQYESYGAMIQRGLSLPNNQYFIDYTSPNLSVSEYNQKIAEDHTNNYAMLSYAAGQWYLIDKILMWSDNLDYDYLIVRQFDTVLRQNYYLEDFERNFITFQKNLIGNAALDSYPLIWVQRQNSGNNPDIIHDFPYIGAIHSSVYVFNRPAIKQLRGRLFERVIEEINYLYKAHGKYSKFFIGHPGALMSMIAMKENIHQVVMEPFAFEFPRETIKCESYARAERL